jgi:PQQ-dependent dehydrogenase (methanol/ethanol family)
MNRTNRMNRFAAAMAGALVALAASQPAIAADDDNPLNVPADQNATIWPGYNNDYAGQRYSTLNTITTQNVAGLKEVCRIQLSEGGSLQSGPILVNGVLYVTTGLDTFAIEPATCKQIWKHSHKPTATIPMVVNRGVAYSDGLVIRGTPDGHLIALDAKTGAPAWDTTIADAAYGEFASAAPIAWQGVVYMGVAGSDWGVRGRVVAIEARTGREVWRFDTIPTGNEVGANTWKDKRSAEHGGGGIWTTFSLDMRTNELFVSVGNPSMDFRADLRPGDNLFTNSLVVLNAQTGALKWWYQAIKNDPWDYDLAAAAVLYESKGDHGARAAVAGKDGYLHVIDRFTRRLLFKVSTTTQFKEAKAPTPKGVKTCPGLIGGSEWNGPAYDVALHQLVVGAVDWCFIESSTKPDYVRGQLAYGGQAKPATDKGTGWVTAFDADTGTVKWKHHMDAPVVAGVTPTGGGVTFTGDTGGTLVALDSKTGKVLFSKAMDGAFGGGIITYAADGKQYVAGVTGNISRLTFGGNGNPSLVVWGL